MKKRGYKIKVHGVVQGVGFRYYTKMKAQELDIVGTVENLEDGTVLIKAYGSEGSMNNFLAWCHKGPSSARVDQLEFEEYELREIDEFRINR